jgi:C1A family cysteine protease
MTKYKYDLIPSEFDERDYRIESIYHTPVSFPTEYSLIDKLKPIRDQGMQGSCSAMTAAVIKEYQERKDIGFTEYMSPQFVYNLRRNKPEEGMTPRDTMQILHRYGIVSEEQYPYNTTKEITQELLRRANKHRIRSYARVHDINGAKSSIIANGPLYVGMPVYDELNNKFWRQTPSHQQFLGGHAIAIVGWNSVGFIIRNSWGEQWGRDGYSYYPYEDWGHHWEIWTLVDADSSQHKLEAIVDNYNKKHRSGCFGRIFSIFKR